jgi:uncharacterized membrane protein YbjE (DUF340 family)
MNEEEIKKIINGSYDDSKEDTIRSMASDFYSRKMLSTAILVWIWAIVFLVGAFYSAFKFFRTDETQLQIMYASIFVPCVVSVGFMKVFAWGMLHRHSIKREIKKLELRIAELNETVKNK